MFSDKPDKADKHEKADGSSNDPYAIMLTHNLLGQPQWSFTKTLLTFTGLSLVMYMVCSAETIFNQLLSPLKDNFKSNIYAQWMEASFLLTCVMVQPVWVKLAERFGRKWPLLASIVVFMVFSIMVGGARTMGALCVGRALQGVGGAGMMPLALVVLTDVLTAGQRAVWMGALGAVIIASKWSGPVVGALLLQSGSGNRWRWAGYINLPLGAVALVILYASLRDIPGPIRRAEEGEKLRRLREFDFLGTLVWLGGSLMILLGLSWGGNEYPWRSATVVCLFVFGFLAIILFGVIEWRWAKWPIIPLTVLRRSRTVIALLASFLIGICMYGMIMFVPVYYMMVVGESPVESACHILWFVLGGCLGSLLAGSLVSVRGGRTFYREWAVLGCLLMTVGYGVLYTWPLAASATVRHAGFQVLVGLGLGLCMQQVLLAAQAGIPADEISTVTTLVDYARTLGGMIGLVIGEVILKDKMFSTVAAAFPFLGSEVFAGQDVVALEGMAPMLAQLPEAMSAGVYEGVVDALRLVFVVDVPFAAVACVLCVALSNIPLHVVLPASRPDEVPEALYRLQQQQQQQRNDANV